MKRFNKFSRRGKGPGSQLPIKHNQKKPFNPEKYGKYWNGIEVQLAKGNKAVNPIPPATQPIIGTLCIGNHKIDITFSEANRIVEEIADAKQRYNVANRLGMLDATSGTYRG
tara:strand:- start:9173 stop:9508 length:336 start_codon:yes stop_codon:yes gene_type:complete